MDEFTLYLRVADLDLEKFFDRVNHDILMGRVAKKVSDKRVLGLIRRYLQAGVLEHGLVEATYEGTPQGGPLTPWTQKINFYRIHHFAGLRAGRRNSKPSPSIRQVPRLLVGSRPTARDGPPLAPTNRAAVGIEWRMVMLSSATTTSLTSNLVMRR